MNICRKLTAAIIGVCTLVLSIDAGADHDEEPRDTTPITLSTTPTSDVALELDSSAVTPDLAEHPLAPLARSPGDRR